MNNKEHTNRNEQLIQNALGAFLRARNGLSNVDSESQHLDEDVLSAFVEGSLSESEAKPVVSHMADCGYCLHVSAELIKLDLAFADEARPAALPEAEPSKVSEVLGGILSRIFGTNDGAVFAHEEKSEDENEDAEKEDE